MDIGILVFPDAEELDFAGPWEAFGIWAEDFDDGVTLRLVAAERQPVRCRKGLTVLPDATLDDAFDLVVVPGGDGTRSLLHREEVLGWLRGHAERDAVVTSVCTGALVLAAAGLLDGRRATTHWSALDELAALADVQVADDARFVDEGPVVTAAGVSAGIDMALHLIARLHSPARARAVRREMQYDPEPPV